MKLLHPHPLLLTLPHPQFVAVKSLIIVASVCFLCFIICNRLKRVRLLEKIRGSILKKNVAILKCATGGMNDDVLLFVRELPGSAGSMVYSERMVLQNG